jgi:hypothetical protein
LTKLLEFVAEAGGVLVALGLDGGEEASLKLDQTIM